MPFTISHVAVVLPFARPLARWRLPSATIIGSMVPDFGLFLPWRPARVETHSLVGLVTFCLPVGLATFWVFQQLLKRPIMEVLPNSAYARWQPFARPADIGSLAQWAMAAVGVLLGAVTHLVWDGFTHEGARGVRMIPILEDPIVDIAGHRLIGARLLQDGSSLVGLLIVLAILSYGLRRGRADRTERALPPSERWLWILGYVLLSIALGLLFLHVRYALHPSTPTLAIAVANYAIAGLRGLAAALIWVCLCLGVRLRTNPTVRAQ